MTNTSESHAATAGEQLSPLRWIHAVYLTFVLFPVMFNPDAGAVQWAAAIVVIAVGLVTLECSHRASLRSRWTSTIPAIAVGSLAAPVIATSMILFVYAAAYATFSEPRRMIPRWWVGLTVLTLLLTWIVPDPLPWSLLSVLPVLIFIWIIGLTGLEEREREDEAIQLRMDNARVEHLSTMSERERIAGDLHDLLGHSLTGVVVRAQLVQRLAETEPQRAAAEAEVIERAAREALAQIRETVSGWRQVDLDTEIAAAADACEAVGVALTVTRDPGLTLIPSTERGRALALRESITNVVRHAHAQVCQVTLDLSDGAVRLSVADDGRGGHAPEGQGLTGMRERISAVGGRVSRAGEHGTTVTVAVPVEVAT